MEAGKGWGEIGRNLKDRCRIVAEASPAADSTLGSQDVL